MIATFNNKNLNNVNFAEIKYISIKGLDIINNSQLENDIKFLIKNNLFFLNKTKVSEVISSNNLVENYSVFKEYPSTLNITINKTIFLAKLKKNNQNFILGSNGKLIEASNNEIDLLKVFQMFLKEF